MVDWEGLAAIKFEHMTVDFCEAHKVVLRRLTLGHALSLTLRREGAVKSGNGLVVCELKPSVVSINSIALAVVGSSSISSTRIGSPLQPLGHTLLRGVDRN